MVIRMDRGTENGLVGAVQYALREHGTDSCASEKSFRYGTSPANIVCVYIHGIVSICDNTNIPHVED